MSDGCMHDNSGRRRVAWGKGMGGGGGCIYYYQSPVILHLHNKPQILLEQLICCPAIPTRGELRGQTHRSFERSDRHEPPVYNIRADNQPEFTKDLLNISVKRQSRVIEIQPVNIHMMLHLHTTMRTYPTLAMPPFRYWRYYHSDIVIYYCFVG